GGPGAWRGRGGPYPRGDRPAARCPGHRGPDHGAFVTTADQILALAAHPASTAEADAGLARFAEAVAAGMNSQVVRALRTLCPADDGPAWRAWLSAAAALSAPGGAAPGDATPDGDAPPDGAGPAGAVPGSAVPGGAHLDGA